MWNPEQNLNAAYKLQLEKVYLCTGRDGYVPFFDPTGTLYNEGPQYGCIQPNKHLKHRFLLLVGKNIEFVSLYRCTSPTSPPPPLLHEMLHFDNTGGCFKSLTFLTLVNSGENISANTATS